MLRKIDNNTAVILSDNPAVKMIEGIYWEAIVFEIKAKKYDEMKPIIPDIDPNINDSSISSLLMNAGLKPITFKSPTSHCLSLTEDQNVADTKIPVVIRDVIMV